MLLLAVGAGVYVYCNPQVLRLGGTQPPVSAGVRDSVLGLGRVLQLTNDGDRPLTHVKVEAANAARNEHVAYQFERIDAHEQKELGWREWGWSVEPDETVKVGADDYALSITFTSAQLRVR